MSSEKIFEAKHTSSARATTTKETSESETVTPHREPDIEAAIESLREMIPKIRTAITELKDAKMRFKDWTVTVGNVNDQYILEMSFKIAVKPKTME